MSCLFVSQLFITTLIHLFIGLKFNQPTILNLKTHLKIQITSLTLQSNKRNRNYNAVLLLIFSKINILNIFSSIFRRSVVITVLKSVLVLHELEEFKAFSHGCQDTDAAAAAKCAHPIWLRITITIHSNIDITLFCAAQV